MVALSQRFSSLWPPLFVNTCGLPVASGCTAIQNSVQLLMETRGYVCTCQRSIHLTSPSLPPRAWSELPSTTTGFAFLQMPVCVLAVNDRFEAHNGD